MARRVSREAGRGQVRGIRLPPGTYRREPAIVEGRVPNGPCDGAGPPPPRPCDGLARHGRPLVPLP